MAKVTTKLQVTLPKALADRYGVRPGDEIDWVAADEIIRVVPHGKKPAPNRVQRIQLFDEATERQRHRQRGTSRKQPPRSRGWTREEIYDRGRPR